MWHADQPIILSFNGIRLEPLCAAHEVGLCEAVRDGELWQLKVTSAPHPTQVPEYIKQATATRTAFAVIRETDGKVLGSTSFYHNTPAVPRIEIGYTWYAQSFQRSHVNTSCKLMLLTYAFEILNCACVGWRTDILNTRSQRAIERLGAKKDGVLRNFETRKDGSIRDTVIYSMLQSEWPAAKAALEKRLASHNN